METVIGVCRYSIDIGFRHCELRPVGNTASDLPEQTISRDGKDRFQSSRVHYCPLVATQCGGGVRKLLKTARPENAAGAEDPRVGSSTIWSRPANNRQSGSAGRRFTGFSPVSVSPLATILGKKQNVYHSFSPCGTRYVCARRPHCNDNQVPASTWVTGIRKPSRLLAPNLVLSPLTEAADYECACRSSVFCRPHKKSEPGVILL